VPSTIRVLNGKRITLGVTGSIAAYKAVALASALHQAGAIVDVAMTPDAQRFVLPLSFEAIIHRPVFADLWTPGIETDIAHVTLGRESDAVLVAPATAHLLAKLAHGLADDPGWPPADRSSSRQRWTLACTPIPPPRPTWPHCASEEWSSSSRSRAIWRADWWESVDWQPRTRSWTRCGRNSVPTATWPAGPSP
jgi:hypothetical protein